MREGAADSSLQTLLAAVDVAQASSVLSHVE